MQELRVHQAIKSELVERSGKKNKSEKKKIKNKKDLETERERERKSEIRAMQRFCRRLVCFMAKPMFRRKFVLILSGPSALYGPLRNLA